MKLKVLREQPASNICIAQVWSLVCSPNKFVCLILRLANDGMIKCVHILTGNSLQHSPFQILLMHCPLNQYSHMAVPYSIKESIFWSGCLLTHEGIYIYRQTLCRTLVRIASSMCSSRLWKADRNSMAYHSIYGIYFTCHLKMDWDA